MPVRNQRAPHIVTDRNEPKPIDDYHEKSPLMTLAKVLEGVREGWIEEGQSVLLAVTGGAGKIPSRAFSSPEKISLRMI